LFFVAGFIPLRFLSRHTVLTKVAGKGIYKATSRLQGGSKGGHQGCHHSSKREAL
jgi:hypothetical protein